MIFKDGLAEAEGSCVCQRSCSEGGLLPQEWFDFVGTVPTKTLQCKLFVSFGFELSLGKFAFFP